MKFYTQYERPAEKMEEHFDEGLVERVGYMDTEKLVNQFILAGEKLRLFRGAEYADGVEIPDDAEPVGPYADEMDVILALRKKVEALNKAVAEVQGNKKIEEKVDEAPVEEPDENGAG